MQLSVILPTLNEAENITPLIQLILRQNIPLHEIIVIDDASQDRTVENVRLLMQKFPKVKLIQRREKRGLATALCHAIDQAEGDVVSWMDCDFSHPPELLPTLLQPLIDKTAKACLASRHLPKSQDLTAQGQSFVAFHKFLSRQLNWFCNKHFNSQLADWTSGFICVYKSELRSEYFSNGYGEYFIRILHDFSFRNVPVVEKPFISPPRKYGESKTATNLWDLVKTGLPYLVTLIKLFRIENRQKAPKAKRV